MALTFSDIFAAAVKDGKILEKNGQAIEWLRKTAQQFTKIDPNKLLSDASVVDSITNNSSIGRLFLFKYNAKTKNKLPYWDKFPVMFYVSTYDDGFLGMNMHYLGPKQRALLMDALYKIANNADFDDTTKLQLSYKLLKKSNSLQAYKPTLKRYLKTYIQSKYIYVSPIDWEMALFLPLQRFQKASDSKVWRDSSKIIRNS